MIPMPTRKWGLPLLRISMSLVFLYFGLSQLWQPFRFVGWLPPEASLIPLAPTTLILFNGVLEVALGLLLLLGVYTRIAALVLGLHLVAIAVTMGFTETAVRDMGLAFATLSVALSGSDGWSLDDKLI